MKKERSRLLNYDKRGSFYPVRDSAFVVNDSSEWGFYPVSQLPSTLEEVKKLALKKGRVVICSPLRVLDSLLNDLPPKERRHLRLVGDINGLSVRPLTTRGITQMRFSEGNKHGYVTNLFPFEDTLEGGLLALNDLTNRFGVGLESARSPAYMAQNILLAQKKSAFIGYVSVMVEEYAYRCYKAGRFELLEPGTQEADVYDIDSAYGWAISNLQHFSGYIEWNTKYSKDAFYAFYYCRVKTGSGRISPVFMRLGDIYNYSAFRCVTPTQIEVEIWLTKPEIDVILESGEASVELLRGISGRVKTDCRPFQRIMAEMWDAKQLGLRKSYKQIMAQLTGKMHSISTFLDDYYNPVRQTSSIFNPVYASHVVGAVRARVLRWAFQDPNNTIRLANDAIWKKAGSTPPEPFTGERLGKINKVSGVVFCATDQFADKPGITKYRDTYDDGTIKVGDALNYPSLRGNPEGDLSKLQSQARVIPIRSTKRDGVREDVDVSSGYYYQPPIAGEESLNESLYRKREDFSDES